MGYESKLFIVNKTKTKLPNAQGLNWANFIASYDLCKCPAVAESFTKHTDCFIFLDNGSGKDNSEHELTRDMHGEPLTEMSVQELIKVLENLNGEAKKYWRIPPLLAMLKSMAEADESEIFGELAVLHYGH